MSNEKPSDRMASHPPILPSKSRACGPPIRRSVFLLKESFRITVNFTGKKLAAVRMTNKPYAGWIE